MKILGRIKAFYLSHFSTPAADRTLHKAIARQRVRKVLQIGMGPAERTVFLIEEVLRHAQGEPVAYVAVDLFEARPPGQSGLALKEAHRLLKPTGAQVQLIPGDPSSTLVRSANSIGQVDLLLISAEHDDASLAGAWFYVPRMLHGGTLVFRQAEGSEKTPADWHLVPHDEIERLASVGRRRRAA